MGIAEEIEKLDDLRQRGTISEDEFEAAKKSVLQGNPSAAGKPGMTFSGISDDVNMWSMFIHLSQLCGVAAPLAGWVVPIVLWQIKKDDSPIIDQHGRIVVNWILSALIYGLGSALLCIVVIGVPMLIALAIACIAFPIIGGIKANNGEMWPYPLSIGFFPVDQD